MVILAGVEALHSVHSVAFTHFSHPTKQSIKYKFINIIYFIILYYFTLTLVYIGLGPVSVWTDTMVSSPSRGAIHTSSTLSIIIASAAVP